MSLRDAAGLTVALLFCACILGGPLTLAFPAVMRVAGPIVCPDGSRAVVAETPVSTVRETTAGGFVDAGTQLSPELFCVDAASRAQRASMFAVIGVLIAAWFCVGVVLAAIAVARRAWGARPSTA